MHGQDTLTVGEVFDFDINDEFRTERTFPSGPPNAFRMKIIGKYFSAMNDTVFYVRSFNNYYSTVVSEPEYHLEYSYSIFTDTMYYTDLDGNLLCPEMDTTCVSIFDTTICGVPANGYDRSFFDSASGAIYGKGLGTVKTYEVDGGIPSGSIVYELVYFKKDTIECGTPDNTSIAWNTSPPSIAAISPNPFTDALTILFPAGHPLYEILVLDATGRQVVQGESTGSTEFAISGLANKGLYIVQIKAGSTNYTLRAVKL